MSYKIKFVDDETFEKLPGQDMWDKVGIAYPKTGEAYVRKSGIDALDLFNAAHELEHLNGEDLGEHYDKENDCYYKKFGQVMKSVAPIALPLAFMIPGVGPAISGALSHIGGAFAGGLGAIPGVGSTLGGAAKSIGAGINAVGNAGSKALSKIGGGAGSNVADQSIEMLSNPLQSSLESKLMASAGGPSFTPSAFASTAGSGFGNALKGFGKEAATSTAQNALGGMFGGQGPMEQFQMVQQNGSYEPQTQIAPNIIPGQSGEGSYGGAGGAQAPVSGSIVARLKQMFGQQRGDDFNG